MAKKRGPKPKPAELKRSVQFKFMVTAEEKTKIDDAAAATGVAAGEFARNAVLKRARRVLQ